MPRYNPQNRESFFFDARNFLQGNTFYSIWRFNHCAKNQDGKLYFAGIAGVSVLTPEALAANSTPPVAKIVGLKINNQTADLEVPIHKLSCATDHPPLSIRDSGRNSAACRQAWYRQNGIQAKTI